MFPIQEGRLLSMAKCTTPTVSDSYMKLEQILQLRYLPHGMSLQLGKNQKKRHPILSLYSQRARIYQAA